MNASDYARIAAIAAEPAQTELTVSYLADHISAFVKKQDRVLICFPDTVGSVGYVYKQAVLRCGGLPVIWGPDYRWKTLLQQAFYSRAKTIIGPPLIIMGLTKLKKYNGIPLYIRHVITAGYPCLDWMIDGIVKGLDCRPWGSFGLGTTGLVAGFSCSAVTGVHLWDSMYGVDIVDEAGNVLPAGSTGEIRLYPKSHPDLRVPVGDAGRIAVDSCKCGSSLPRLVDIQPDKNTDPELAELGQYLQSWTSVLDCRLSKGEYGLEMELVVFPGEKLPKLPSAAKRVIRPWDPKHDEPFEYRTSLKK